MLLNILWNPKLDMGMEGMLFKLVIAWLLTIILCIEKAELFLEVYGNLLVRDKTAQFINTQASKLIRCVTDGEGPLAKLFDFRHLKFRERDDLEFVFKFWRDQKRGFDAAKLWYYLYLKYSIRQYSKFVGNSDLSGTLDDALMPEKTLLTGITTWRSSKRYPPYSF